MVIKKIAQIFFQKSENLYICCLIQYSCYITAKAEEPNVNNGLDTGKIKAVNLAGLIVTSANIVGKTVG